MKNPHGVYSSLESLEINNNVLVFFYKSTWNQKAFKFGSAVGAMSLLSTEVHFKQTEVLDNNNNIPAVLSYTKDLHFHGVNIFKNNSGRECGSALVLRATSQMYLHRGTQVYILQVIQHSSMEEEYVWMVLQPLNI